MVLDYENCINSQRLSTSRLMDRVILVDIGSKITHEAIKMLMKEWNEAEMWAHRISENEDTPPQDPRRHGCQLSCDSPPRFQLPCKCWLYTCRQHGLPIPLSLIYPRWYFDGPSYISDWVMSFASLPEIQLDSIQSNLQIAGAHEDRYRNHGTSLVEGATLSMLDYHKKLLGNRKEVYAKGARQLVEEYNNKFEEKEKS